MSDGQDIRRYAIAEGIEVYPAAGHLIAVDSGRKVVHHLNETATLILQACDGRTGAEICAHLAEEYPDVPTERLASDVWRALEVLASKGVVRPMAPVRPDPRSEGGGTG